MLLNFNNRGFEAGNAGDTYIAKQSPVPAAYSEVRSTRLQVSSWGLRKARDLPRGRTQTSRSYSTRVAGAVMWFEPSQRRRLANLEIGRLYLSDVLVSRGETKADEVS
jgi:hypothetical protein